jgi:hypothetical protein
MSFVSGSSQWRRGRPGKSCRSPIRPFDGPRLGILVASSCTGLVFDLGRSSRKRRWDRANKSKAENFSLFTLVGVPIFRLMPRFNPANLN